MERNQFRRLRAYLLEHFPETTLIEGMDIAIVDFEEGIIVYSQEIMDAELMAMSVGDPIGVFEYFNKNIKPLEVLGEIKIISTNKR